MDPETVFFTGIFLMLLMADTGMGMTAPRLYHFVNYPKTWSEAQNFCRVNYDDLATIDDMKEHVQVVETIGNAEVYNTWIGLERSGAELWLWSEGIGEVTVFSWNIDKSYGDCTLMKSNSYWFVHQCSEQWPFLCLEYDSMGKELYYLYTQPKSWQEAQSYCREHHTDLVSVKTLEENANIFTHGGGNNMWMGLIRDGWKWSDKSPRSFRNWAMSKPDIDDNCALMSKSLNYQWDDIPCNASFPFVCYGKRKMKRFMVKVIISSEVNLNLPAESDSLLKQFQQRLDEQGVTEFRIRWQADKNEQIFHRKQDEVDTEAIQRFLHGEVMELFTEDK